MKKNLLNKTIFILIILISQNSAYAQDDSFPALKKLEKEGNQVSAMAVRLSDGKIIAELNSEKRLSPASVTKLILASKAIDTWGIDKTFTTKVFMRGKLNKEILNGDLIFYGVGDPSLTNEKLWFISTDVARYGIKKITGKIIVNNSFYGKVTDDENRIAGKTKSQNAYDSPLSSAAVNFSVLALVISPAQEEGHTAHIALEPYAMSNVKILGSVKTTKESSNTQLSVSRTSKNGKDTYIVSGNIALGSTPQRIYRSVSDPNLYAGETFNAFLNSAGVETSGMIDIDTSNITKNDVLVSQIESFPLDWQLRGLFQVSNNFIADMLTLNLINETNSKNKGDLKAGGKILEQYLKNIIQNSPWHDQKNQNSPIIIESGSGLTPNNRLSAKDIISVLDQMYFNGRGFPAYLAALPVIGEEGTLKKRFASSSEKHLQGRLRAKTGTLTEPVHVSALGGYSRLRNGDWVSFAIIVNGMKSKPQIDLKNIRDAIDSDLAKVLPSEL
ncbi:D-alanyl-D-alanine carboxypeptidase/D-alanyl-D-alanine-endopeptidase [Silvanigrella aquatica]|uniref:D-alanyl-D-alanine carboxypeptidase/D-alanyl-D-alanine-endopeptidase n=1 Tax=Silvanigrella aquatica TaxID=1915309 RepID=A0A1L4CXN1_9BACT|nr:D-alanyl-D-alanine carboxypeptidase/D-alanyl-D-alanine-endopeptidase [Silvanigrella aquatica]APJ02700.1 D-alanyl-D-alanine carboxypeptidase/D-alanyl-D-alanine-endopeptidase [Silvanigrella aquatica]